MEQLKSAIYKKNFWLLVLEGTFFMGATGFYSSSTVIPVFIDTMTHSKELVGLTLTLATFFTYAGRLFVGPFMPQIRNHARFCTIVMFSARPALLFPAIFIFTGQLNASVLILIISYSIFWICDGLIAPAWAEVLANTVDGNYHGRLLGLQMLIGGAAGIGAGALINIFMSNPNYNVKLVYGWIFLIGGLLSVLSCCMMAFTQNALRSHNSGRVNISGYFRELPKYLKNERDYTRMMVVQVIFLFAAMCIPFTILFAGDILKIPQKSIALLIMAQSLGVPLGGWMWGQICDRIGIHNGIRLAGFNIILIALLPLLAVLIHGINPLLIMLPVLFFAGVSNGIWSCYYLYTVQAVRPDSRPACIVLSSIITLPTSFGGYIAGFISEKFGFTQLFLISICLTAAGMVLAFRLRPVKAVVEEREK